MYCPFPIILNDYRSLTVFTTGYSTRSDPEPESEPGRVTHIHLSRSRSRNRNRTRTGPGPGIHTKRVLVFHYILISYCIIHNLAACLGYLLARVGPCSYGEALIPPNRGPSALD